MAYNVCYKHSCDPNEDPTMRITTCYKAWCPSMWVTSMCVARMEIRVVSSARAGDHAGEHPTVAGSPLTHPLLTPTTI
eukprot:6012486-Pleurochrysis_carterae.AAC.1